MVSILDIDPKNPPEKGYQNIINSPRTLEACLRQGVDPSEFNPVTETYVRRML
jgi:hypothetical protein